MSKPFHISMTDQFEQDLLDRLMDYHHNGGVQPDTEFWQQRKQKRTMEADEQVDA